jgi:formylglycine-generating enzyme required for sulfatase activity
MNSADTTHPVGQKAPNAWGFHDMLGNVYEWCSDLYGKYPRKAVSDPTGATKGEDRVYRGGCWAGDGSVCRAALRWRHLPTSRYPFLGFRNARSAD